MASVPKGHMLIINNHKFNGQEERTGTHIDRNALFALFKDQLNFYVEVQEELNAQVHFSFVIIQLSICPSLPFPPPREDRVGSGI